MTWRTLLGATVVCCAAGIGVARADDAGLHFNQNGLEYRSSDDNVRINLGGRLHLDTASVDTGTTTTESSETRRARLELSVRLYDRLRFRIDREFAHGGGWRNVWASYDLSDRYTVKAGNFIAPFSMEDLSSSNETTFMERSLTQALAPSFGVGVGATYSGRQFTLSGAYLGDAIDAEDNVQAKKGRGVALRATWSQEGDHRQTLHFGAGFDHREFDAGQSRSISSGAEASLSPTIVRTGAIANVDTTQSFNGELGYSIGPVLFQGQYVSTDVQRTAGPDMTFSGYYAQVAWVVTGERHGYSNGAGTFSSPEPRGRWGAVEVAARVSSLDLSDSPVGGQADDSTVGVNWYIGHNVRLMANYVHSKVDGVTPLQDRDTDVVEARAQVSF